MFFRLVNIVLSLHGTLGNRSGEVDGEIGPQCRKRVLVSEGAYSFPTLVILAKDLFRHLTFLKIPKSVIPPIWPPQSKLNFQLLAISTNVTDANGCEMTHLGRRWTCADDHQTSNS